VRVSGVEWSGVEWSAVEWSAVEWSRVRKTVVRQSPASKNVNTQVEDILGSRYKKTGENTAN
jgi:hypothetical protein